MFANNFVKFWTSGSGETRSAAPRFRDKIRQWCKGNWYIFMGGIYVRIGKSLFKKENVCSQDEAYSFISELTLIQKCTVKQTKDVL